MRRNLFLYLALTCFLALIVIFFVDGYMGIYDTTYITVGEQEQIIEPDYWLQQYPPGVEMTYYHRGTVGAEIILPLRN